jgi:hypothetical protein
MAETKTTTTKAAIIEEFLTWLREEGELFSLKKKWKVEGCRSKSILSL